MAADDAFCFTYQDNLKLLETMGAELVFFSPLQDKKLPEEVDGMILSGGYPELHAKTLSENHSMREAIRKAIEDGYALYRGMRRFSLSSPGAGRTGRCVLSYGRSIGCEGLQNGPAGTVLDILL